MGGEFSYSKKIVNWWNIDLGINLFYFQIIGQIPGASLNQENFTYRVRMSNSFILPNDFKIQFITNFIADVVSVQGIDKGYTSFDLALKKDFREGKVSTTFQFSNFLSTERRETRVETPTLYSYRMAWFFFILCSFN